jgi:hypothetical protein
MGDYKITLDNWAVLYGLQKKSAKAQGRQECNYNTPIIADVWNPYAKLAGGKPIRSEISWGNADQSIQSYTPNIPLEKSYGIADLLGFHRVTREETQQYDSNARNFLKELAENPEAITFEKRDNPQDDPNQGYWIEAKLPDGRSVSFAFDTNGEKDKLVFVAVNFDTRPNFIDPETGDTEDYDDTYYASYDNTMGYTTTDGPHGDALYTSSQGYNIGGVPFKEIEQLSNEILKHYKP